MHTEIRDELKEQQSILGKIEKTYFVSSDVPEGYFDQMEDSFFEQLKADHQPKASVSISLWEKVRVSYAVAAVSAFAVVGLGLFSILRTDGMNKLSQNEVASYLEEEDECVNCLKEVEHQDHIAKINELSKEEIELYLIEDEGIDVSEI